MLDFSLTPPTVPLLERVAAFAERRHDVLAGNLANISTPGYKTRDLPVAAFQAALRQAVATSPSTPSPSLGHLSGGLSEGPRTLQELFPQSLYQAAERPPETLTFQDAGNRDLESEVMEISKNAMLQSFAVELMTAQFNLLQSVVRGQA